MKGRIRLAVAALAACLLAVAVGIGRSAAGEGRREKVRRLVEKLEYPQRFRAMVRAEFERKYKGDADKVEGALALVKWDPLLDFVAEELDAELDFATVDDLLPYLDTPEGKRHLSLLRLDRARSGVELVFLVSRASSEPKFEAMMKKWEAAFTEATGEPGRLSGAKLSSNETAAIATLRNLASAQAMIQTTGKIDGDRDGIGEYGTFLEMTGSVGVRTGNGTPVNPSILSAALAGVDADGIVTKSGYCFRIFLPDTASPAGFVHEKGPKASFGFAGGTGTIGVDLAETTWCAYAWPAARGSSGNRAFFVNQSGDVMQSADEAAQWSGPAKGPPGGSAFLKGAGITGRVAVGTAGSDGDVWKVTN